MRTSTWTVLSLSLLLVTVSMVAVPAAAETPENTTCDETGLIACAGADATASVDCEMVTSSTAKCTFSHGWNLAGWSPAGLPGSVDYQMDKAVEVCVTGQDCFGAESTVNGGCVWEAGDECSQTDSSGNSVIWGLEAGQCLSVEATTFAAAETWVPTVALPAGSVSTQETSVATGEVCALDAGR